MKKPYSTELYACYPDQFLDEFRAIVSVPGMGRGEFAKGCGLSLTTFNNYYGGYVVPDRWKCVGLIAMAKEYAEQCRRK
jgi:hypothetical protein